MRNLICFMRVKKEMSGLRQEFNFISNKKLQTFVLKIIIQDILVFVKMLNHVRFHI